MSIRYRLATMLMIILLLPKVAAAGQLAHALSFRLSGSIDENHAPLTNAKDASSLSGTFGVGLLYDLLIDRGGTSVFGISTSATLHFLRTATFNQADTYLFHPSLIKVRWHELNLDAQLKFTYNNYFYSSAGIGVALGTKPQFNTKRTLPIDNFKAARYPYFVTELGGNIELSPRADQPWPSPTKALHMAIRYTSNIASWRAHLSDHQVATRFSLAVHLGFGLGWYPPKKEVSY
jgi:hypothetical protein